MVVLSAPPYCGCSVTVVVLMYLRSTPWPATASVTAAARLLVWLDAPIASGAVAAIDRLMTSVSGVPSTLPSPTTVTCGGAVGPGTADGAGVASQATTATAVTAAPASRSKRVS